MAAFDEFQSELKNEIYERAFAKQERPQAPSPSDLDREPFLAIACGVVAFLAWQSTEEACTEEEAVEAAKTAIMAHGGEKVTARSFVEVVKEARNLLYDEG